MSPLNEGLNSDFDFRELQEHRDRGHRVYEVSKTRAECPRIFECSCGRLIWVNKMVVLTDGAKITHGQAMIAVNWLRRDLRILPT